MIKKLLVAVAATTLLLTGCSNEWGCGFSKFERRGC